MTFIDCGGVTLSGRVQEVREKLMNMLTDEHNVPEYETQDDIRVYDVQ